MASPDHATTIRTATGHIARGCRGTGSHEPSVYLIEIDTALDALVAALAKAERERDAALDRESGTNDALDGLRWTRRRGG